MVSNKDKFKVIFLGKLPPPYIGPSVACQLILNSPLKDKFDLHHLDLSDHRDINTLAKLDFTNFYLAFKQYWMLFRMILKQKPNLVYVPAGQTTVGYFRDAGYILISKMLGVKVITQLRGGYFRNWYNESGPLVRAGVRFVHKKVNGQIVLGNNLRTLFNWLIPNEHIYVVPNGGDYKLQKRTKTDDKIRVLFLGNYIGTKGVLEALYSSKEVCNANSKVEYHFVGNWREKDTKDKFLKFTGENPTIPIINHGPQKGDEKFQTLSNADIFVFPTYYRNEGHPWVIVEAMANSLPIISTDHGAISESVIHGKNGYLVEKKNVADLASRILELCNDDDKRNQMGKESRDLYEKEFTETRLVERFEYAFNQVIKS